MVMPSDYIILAATMVVIIITSHYAIKSCLKLAARFKYSDELVGMSILAIGTSLPEIITHVASSYKILLDPTQINQLSSLSVGASIGSDVFQQTFILGLVALVGSITIYKKYVKRDVGALIGASALLFILALDGVISRTDGFLLFAGYLFYLHYLKATGTVIKPNLVEKKETEMQIIGDIVTVILSFLFMAYAANIMVETSLTLVDALPVSASFFGVILVGVATSFPELATSLLAVLKKRQKVSAGILIGSNITNPMFAVGLGALISTYTVPQVLIVFDLPVAIFTGGILYYLFVHNERFSKKSAIIFIGLFLLYLLLRNIWFPTDVLF